MPLKLYQRGRIWYCAGTVAGRRYRFSTGATEKAHAQRIAAEAEHKAWQRRFDGPGAGLTMAQAMNAYLDAKRPERFLLKLAEHFKDTLVETLTAESIRRDARKIYPNANPATLNRQVIKPTQAVINYCADLGWCRRISVKRYHENPAIKTPATLAWVRSFDAQARNDGLPHLGALCLFMFGTAARVGEACRLTWADMDLSNATATIDLFKPEPWTRTAHLPPDVVAALANIPSNRNPDDLVFGYAGRGSVRGPWNNVCKRAKIERLTPHCCRHGFATTMLHKGFDPKTVADRGGWKDAVTVLRTYAHALKDRTVTDRLFDTELTQVEAENRVSIGNKRGKST
ncbi:tyrosine-type recombinase/integrase [Roseovarius mucosus]